MEIGEGNLGDLKESKAQPSHRQITTTGDTDFQSSEPNESHQLKNNVR